MTIKVKKIISSSPITSKDGREFMKYQILTDTDEVLDTFSKVEEGQSYEGEVTTNSYGKQFKKAKQGFGGYKNDPLTPKQIIRQNALTNAVNYCIAKANLDKNYKLTGKEVVQVATYFAKYSLGEITVVTESKPKEEPKDDFIAGLEKDQDEAFGEEIDLDKVEL